jgi:hypothetical protein
MAKVKPEPQTVPLVELTEVIRAVNTQARLLAEIVHAAQHIVKSYQDITKVVEATDETKAEKPK